MTQDDGSGFLEVEELAAVLRWFEANVPGEDLIFETIWKVDKAPRLQLAGEQIMQGFGNKDERRPKPATVVAVEILSPAQAPIDDFAAFTEAALGSLAIEGQPPPLLKGKQASQADAMLRLKDQGGDYKLDVVMFRKWLLALAGHLTTQTFTEAIAKLSVVASRHSAAKRIFEIWDADSSGSLEFAELRRVMNWIKKNVPSSELNFETMWDALPDAGTADLQVFNEWILTVTKDMSPQGFDQLQEKLKAALLEPISSVSQATTTALEAELTVASVEA